MVHMAALGDHVEAIRALAEHGADVNCAVCGITPVMTAAGDGYTRVIKLLYKLGADMKPAIGLAKCAERKDHTAAVKVIGKIMNKLTSDASVSFVAARASG